MKTLTEQKKSNVMSYKFGDKTYCPECIEKVSPSEEISEYWWNPTEYGIIEEKCFNCGKTITYNKN